MKRGRQVYDDMTDLFLALPLSEYFEFEEKEYPDGMIERRWLGKSEVIDMKYFPVIE